MASGFLSSLGFKKPAWLPSLGGQDADEVSELTAYKLPLLVPLSFVGLIVGE